VLQATQEEDLNERERSSQEEHCNTLQHTATYCNILQHTETQKKTGNEPERSSQEELYNIL